ncbi:unnamed protein product [Ceratitis capitata]|uniref:(Mediterranean fruit fly) hypothetical protein n=1 Tax=Ceratitis capitata TaxID=7213 RepID=A0A811U0A8_CERCA|nr:unnamed protein product [Ceratitis capitata]
MTTSDEFCRDHYEHPLLWCDDKKRLVERKNAEESMRMWRRRKAEEVARKEKDKAEMIFKLKIKFSLNISWTYHQRGVLD